LHVASEDIRADYIKSISEILEDPTSLEGDKFYAQDYEDSAPCHAKLYCVGDKYDIPSLQKLALDRLRKDIQNRSLDDNVVVKALHVLMDNSPETDQRARMLVVEYLHRDMDRFGIRPCNRSFFERYPDLHEHYLRHQFGDDQKDSVE
jgi:hypothetical protein